MTRETAYAYWGKDAVEHALRHETPERITETLTSEVKTRAESESPGAFRAWALTQPWPRFCSIVWIVSGALRDRLADGNFPKTLLAEGDDDDR